MLESSVVQHFIERGILQGKREDLLKTLEVRFQATSAEALKPSLEVIDDLQRLEELFLLALKTPSIDDFTHELLGIKN